MMKNTKVIKMICNAIILFGSIVILVNVSPFISKPLTNLSVGLIKMRMQRFGHATLGAVQKTPKNTTVHSAYRSVSRMRASFPAPKFVEMMGWDACPTLYAQHWTKVLMLMMIP